MKTKATSTPWLILAKPNPVASRRLFCVPYAGGSPLVFSDWPLDLPPDVEVGLIQLPGRGMRLSQPPFTKVEPLVESLVQALHPFLDKPFAFYGHSMGGLICFELSRALRLKFNLEPEVLFVSGRQAPPLRDRTAATYDLPERQFINELGHLNGTPPEVLEQPELMKLLVPLLRADFELCQTYVYQPGPPLACALSVFGGVDDSEVNQEELEGWREFTTGPFSLRMLPGDHFFIRTARTQLLRLISQDLKTYQKVPAGRR
jgi:medium-chain acyl-[acyl-carrier-protein] hydrolase